MAYLRKSEGFPALISHLRCQAANVYESIDIEARLPIVQPLHPLLEAGKSKCNSNYGIVKHLLAIGGVILGIFLMSSTSNPIMTPVVGTEAPAFILTTTDDTSLSLHELKGQYVLLNFWSKSQPLTRIANHTYNVATADAGIRYISVCLDRDEEQLATMINAEDGNDTATQYVRSQLQRSSGTEWIQTPAAWLISPEGKIIARNPSPASLAVL